LMATQDAHSRSGLDEGEQVKLIAIARNVTAELLFNPIVDLVHPEKRPASSPTAGRDVRNVQRLRMSITGRSSGAA